MARKERKPVHHVEMTDGKRSIIQGLLQEYDIKDAQDIQDALKDLQVTARIAIIGMATKVSVLIPVVIRQIKRCLIHHFIFGFPRVCVQ